MKTAEKVSELDFKTAFLNKLNEIKKDTYGGNGYPFSMRQLNYHAFSSNNSKRYIQFQIPKKKKGEFRTITAPNAGLKSIQRCINSLLLESYTPHASAYGFVKNKSIVENARTHVGQNFIYNIDLKDFFPSIKAGRVFACLLLPPLSFDKNTASLITDLCCHEGRLPQGAPTSPTLTNIVCNRMDWRLTKLAKRYGLRYTRYADDITFSGMNNVFHEEGQFIKELRYFIGKEGFLINDDKTRLNNNYQRQEVTGLTINEKPNVSQKYVKQIRTILNNWEKSGYDHAQSVFLKFYHPTKHIEGQHHVENILKGKLDYLKMVKGDKDETYKKLYNRFERLVGGTERDIDPNEIIRIWEHSGLGAAKKSYTKRAKEPQLSVDVFVDKILSSPSSTSGIKKKVASLLIESSIKKKTQTLSAEKESGIILKANKGLYHDPEFVSRFLHQFTEKDCQALKFTTHYWDKDSDGNFNYDSFKAFKEAYLNILLDKNKSLDSYKELYPSIISNQGSRSSTNITQLEILNYRCEHLWQLIRNFLVNDDATYPWGEHKLKIGYNKYLNDWMDKNPQQQPFAMPLSYYQEIGLPELIPQKLINGKKLYDFGDVVELFKHCIEFRDDDLYKTARIIFKSSDISINKELLSTLKGCVFYTDTSLVKNALRVIAGNIHQRTEHPNVEISCITNEEANRKRISLELLQIDSYSYRDVTDAKIDPNSNEGDLATIKNQLRNLCDFSIESLFKVNGVVKPLRINYLSSNFDNYQIIEDIDEKSCAGFKYILNFYNYK